MKEMRSRIAAMLCAGCARRDPIDKEGRHVHEYKQEAFGSTWDSTSWLPCMATPVLIEKWVAFVEQVVKEEKEEATSSKKNRKKGIR